jgi:uncharacterized membrane protein YbhN (UPF0104 family)
VLLLAALGLLIAVGIYELLPRLAGLDDVWQRVSTMDPAWLGAALALEALSYAGYVMLFLVVLGGGRVDRSLAWLVTAAGVAATRVIGAGGAGGIALTAWALRRSGRDARSVAAGITAFLVLLYAVYMAALVLGGTLLLTGVAADGVPAAFAATAIAVGGVVGTAAVALALLPPRTRTRRAGWARALAAVPSGVRHALGLLRTRDPRLLGAVAWWGFDIATLWACLSAFGDPPAAVALIVAYFMGMLGNLLPLPGGVGGVDGGMIAALIAVGVSPGLAVIGVLGYRVFSFWLPTLVGVPAYLALVRRVHRWDTARAQP